MSYIGQVGVSNLDPENRFNFDRAEQMVKEDFDPTVIKIQTGWEQGIDNFWRYEIPDPFMECIYSLKSGPVSHSKMGHPRERTKLIK